MGQRPFTVQDLLAHPSGELFLRLGAVQSEESLAEFAERELHDAIRIVEENPQHAQGFNEDQITNLLVVSLRSKCLQVDHDSMMGGHADIVIRHRRLKWVAEAKIFDGRGFLWLMKGLLQLTTRYMPARTCRGALIVYTFRSDPLEIMQKLQRRLVATKRVVGSNWCSYCQLSFYVDLKHPRSGLQAKVRHTVMCLHYRPEV